MIVGRNERVCGCECSIARHSRKVRRGGRGLQIQKENIAGKLSLGKGVEKYESLVEEGETTED